LSGGISGVPSDVGVGGALLWAVLAIAGAALFQISRIGLRLRASREDDIAARALGVKVPSERRYAFVVSAFWCAIGGGVFAQFIGSFNANSFYLAITFLTIVMLVVGGSKSLAGAVVGSVFIYSASELLIRIEEGLSVGPLRLPARPGLEEVALATIMLVTLVLRPNGITGGREVPVPKVVRERIRTVARGSDSSLDKG
jgi:branched-chain amino acid transport system permease protein